MQLYQVDAFAERAFEGNPAAVCVLDRSVSEDWMQHVAAEMNLSETAFVSTNGAGFDLRWFTPLVEVALCGHATLATALVLFETGLASAPVSFSTKSGLLHADREDEQIRLDFPALAATPIVPPAGLLEALGIENGAVYRSDFDALVDIDDESRVADLKPDFAALREIDVRGVIVTAPSQRYDFVSRFFAPAVGINEDPATGSAHCVLGPYWSVRLGKSELRARQLSARGASIGVRVRGDRVDLLGRGEIVLEGQLRA